MKNVKPIKGQVWKENPTGNDYVIDINPAGWISGQGKTFGFGGYSKSAFLREFTFIPQTDLEWLACNRLGYSVHPSGYTSAIKINNNFVYQPGGTHGSHTLVEIQNKHYELGLDDHPIIKLTKAHAASMGRAPDNQKETEVNTDKLIPTDYSRNIAKLIAGDTVYNSFVDHEYVLDAAQANDLNATDSDFSTTFLVSFAERPNTGKRPVEDWVPVDVYYNSKWREARAGVPQWKFSGKDGWHYEIKFWRINFDALHNIYTKEIAMQQKPGHDPAQLMPIDVMLNAVFGGNDSAKPECYAKASKPVYTRAMADANEPPPVGSKFKIANFEKDSRISDFMDKEVTVIGLCHNEVDGTIVTFSHPFIGTGCGRYSNRWMQPIDTRTDKEKLIDALVDELNKPDNKTIDEDGFIYLRLPKRMVSDGVKRVGK